MNTILVTGATSGIGKAIAIKYAKNNYNVIITGRRKENLELLKEELISKYKANIYSLCFDIRNYDETKSAIDSLPENFKKIDILVNNAGLAVGLGPINEGVIDDWERMIDTNIKGLLYITRIISTIMTDNKKGHIINIGSVAGKEVYANGNVYCATKFAVDALSKAMRIDLLKHGIKVTSIHPGMVETEFSLVRFKGDKETADNVYKGFKPLLGNDIAEIVYYTTSLPYHININDMVVMPTAQASPYHLNKEIS